MQTMLLASPVACRLEPGAEAITAGEEGPLIQYNII